MLDDRAIRITNAVQYQVTEAITQFFPELMEKATTIVNSEQMLVDSHPEHEDSIRELCQLKLDTLAPCYVMDRIKHQKEKAQKEVISRVKVWAKDYSFGAYLDAKGQLDAKKVKKDFHRNGGSKWVTSVVNEFNDKLVPYANQLRDELDAEYTEQQRNQGNKLNAMLVRHNQLVMRNKHLIPVA